jgi:small subunit ribosomal protein S17
MANTTTQENKPVVRHQTFTGTVVSAKMKDTCVVVVERYMKHAVYGKYMTRKTKIMAHDPGNTKKEGEKATVEACRPISKRKAFKIIA